MGKVKVYISNRQKEIRIPTGLRLLIRKCCHAVLEQERFNDDAEVSVALVNNNEIQELNQKYRDKNVPTDVLSFPLLKEGRYPKGEEGFLTLGDVVISMQKAVEQAKQYGHSLQREVAYLTVHSMLHLLGYDHSEGGMKAVRMREKEESVLQLLGLPRNESYAMSDEIEK